MIIILLVTINNQFWFFEEGDKIMYQRMIEQLRDPDRDIDIHALAGVIKELYLQNDAMAIVKMKQVYLDGLIKERLSPAEARDIADSNLEFAARLADLVVRSGGREYLEQLFQELPVDGPINRWYRQVNDN
ncbi:hypothetical protein J4444_00020 [Candidatus Woesearchaeota archaeon]|nr:hypothetical protein [Candidatus Woesearchaeota archaeon]